MSPARDLAQYCATRSSAENASAWEAAWRAYVAKLERLDELKAAGRYGYQLRMPRKALAIARERLDALEAALVLRKQA